MNRHSSRNSDFLYDKIAGEIRSLIETGTLSPGDKLPSVRKLSGQKKVSISTILQAYMALESEKLIEARPQSGYYVSAASLLRFPEPLEFCPSDPPRTVEVADNVMELFNASGRPDIIPLGVSYSMPGLISNQKLAKIVSRVSRDHSEFLSRYMFQAADPEFARQISIRAFDYGCNLHPDEIIATFGCTEAFNLSLRAVARAGDLIAVESPTYYGILEIIESLNMKTVSICTDPKNGVCLQSLVDTLEEHDVKACVLMPNFQNPLGYRMSAERKRKVFDILDDYGVPLIEDDIYGDLHFRGNRPRPFKAFDQNGSVLLCSSFSKTLAPGLRLGWVAAGKYRDRILRLKYLNTMGTPEAPQRALAEYLKSGGYDRHLRNLRSSFQRQICQMSQAVYRYFPEGSLVTRPEGGNLLWVQLPETIDTLELYRRALQRNIVIAPGALFAACCLNACIPHDEPCMFRNCLRLACGAPCDDRVEAALKTLGGLAADIASGLDSGIKPQKAG